MIIDYKLYSSLIIRVRSNPASINVTISVAEQMINCFVVETSICKITKNWQCDFSLEHSARNRIKIMLRMYFLIEDGRRVKIVPDKTIHLDQMRLHSRQVGAFYYSIGQEAGDCMPSRSLSRTDIVAYITQ